jgi:hypothetical protein
MRVALFFGVVVLLAGCSGLPVDTGTDTTPTEDRSPAATPLSTTGDSTATAPATDERATTGATPTAASRTTEIGDPADGETTDDGTATTADNPWGERTVSVALVRNGHDGTDYERALLETFDYWQNHIALADYQVAFELVNDTADADVRVEIREEVGSCGYDQGEYLVGCAPLIERGTEPDRPATVRIEAGFDRRSTRSVMIHEFGHVLGIGHGEPPESYMTANNTLFTVERPDATERAYPWGTTDFRVYVATADLPDDERTATREQVRHVVDYYNRVRDVDESVPSNVSFRLVETPTEANVLVSFPGQLSCGPDEGSCGGLFGPDLDGDGAIETYDRLNVTVSGLDADARGWHVGYWVGRSLGIAESDLPDPFVDPSYREIRSDWWTEAP